MDDADRVRLRIVGIGPGDASLVTEQAREALSASAEVWLRTARHPAVSKLPAGPRYRSFDDVYDSVDSFDAIYQTIVNRVLDLARRGDAVYAVPGHPLFGEATVRTLLPRARAAGLKIELIPGLSFVDAAVSALAIDPVADGLLLLDGLSLGDRGRRLVPQRPTLIAQVYDQRTASHVKLALLDAYPADHLVRVIRSAGAGGRVMDTTVAALDRGNVFDHLSTVYIPPLSIVDDVRSFEGLRAIVARLRSPEGGCPWDLEQTHDTLKRFLLEEAYEALDALDEGEPHRLAEELGDLMMQVLLHAQVAEDNGDFAVDEVIRSIATKLVRRHPHVFGDVAVESAGDVLRNWEALKQQERGGASALDHVPRAMPALAQAQALQSRAVKTALAPEVSEDQTAVVGRHLAASGSMTRNDFGDLLFAIVALAVARGVDAEEALRLANGKFRESIAART